MASQSYGDGICLITDPTRHTRPYPVDGIAYPTASPLCATSPVQDYHTCCPSPTLIISLGLGPDYPWGVCRSPGTLGYSVCGVVTRMTLLIPAFALRFTPAALTVDLLCYPRTLPYPWHCCQGTASVVCLSPVTFSAQSDSTSELLRTLERMAASEPTSWLSGPDHILCH